MKTKIVILAVLVMLLITSLSTGCFDDDTAHHTKVSVVAYDSDGSSFDGKYNIIINKGLSIHSKYPARNSNVYNFSLKNGDWHLHIDKETIIAVEVNPSDIIFVTNDETDFILIIILIPIGGTADDVHAEDIIVTGAKTKSVEVE